MATRTSPLSEKKAPLRDKKTRAIGPEMGTDTQADENFLVYREYRGAYRGYHVQMEEDWEFARLGMQWTEDEVQALKANGQAPIVVNQLRRIVEQYIAMMAGRAPRWRVVPRVAGATEVANILSDLLSYNWDISGGDLILQQVIGDSLIRGVGAAMAYMDPNSDYGRGDIKIAYVHPRTLYFDPSMRDPLAKDSEHAIISQLISKSRLAQMYPSRVADIEKAGIDHTDEDYVATSKAPADGQYGWAAGDKLKRSREQLRVIDRYTKILMPHLMVMHPVSGDPIDLVPKHEEKRIKELIDLTNLAIKAQYPEARDISIDQYEIRELNVPRIRQVVSMTTDPNENNYTRRLPGGAVLTDQILPISRYPVVPFYNIFCGNPFGIGEARDLRSVQEFVNKMFSLLVKSATGIASGGQWIVPKESGAMEEVEEKGSMPNAIIGYAGGPQNAPVKTAPGNLPAGHFNLIAKAEEIMDSVSGMSAQLQGAPIGDRESAALRGMRNAEATRRPDQKLKGVEMGLSELGQVVLEMDQRFYVDKKIFHISDTAGDLLQMSIDPRGQNGPMLTGLDGDAIYGSINVGAYQVKVSPGSTRPTNRIERLEESLKLRQMGLADAQAVAEYIDDPKLKASALRLNEISQLQQQIQAQETQLSELKKRASVAENESLNARKAVDIAQHNAQLETLEAAFKRRLDGIEKRVAIMAGTMTGKMDAERRVAEVQAKSAVQQAEVQPKEVQGG